MIRYNPRGLSPNEVAESRRQHGDNVITPPKDDSVWKLLADKFRDPIIRILLLAAVLSLAIGFVHKDFTESIGIICAIILATCVGFWFEWDAMRRFRRLNQVNDDIPVKVMRDGAIREIPRREVVVGDVVYVESGETVPADGELVSGAEQGHAHAGEGEGEGGVVVGEIVGRDEVDACLLQQVPVFSAEISGGILQFITVDLTSPIGFASLLEFTLLTNARIAQHICLDVFDTTHISCFLCCYSFSAAKVRRRILSAKYSFVFRKTF